MAARAVLLKHLLPTIRVRRRDPFGLLLLFRILRRIGGLSQKGKNADPSCRCSDDPAPHPICWPLWFGVEVCDVFAASNSPGQTENIPHAVVTLHAIEAIVP